MLELLVVVNVSSSFGNSCRLPVRWLGLANGELRVGLGFGGALRVSAGGEVVDFTASGEL